MATQRLVFALLLPVTQAAVLIGKGPCCGSVMRSRGLFLIRPPCPMDGRGAVG